MYTCGPTVYGFAHIGNFRAFVFEDLLRRWFEFQGFHVTHVMNITDVDDKTIVASMAQGVSLKKYTEKYTQAFFEDLTTLNILPAHYFPRATEHIFDMVTLIKKLITTKYAYRGENGSTYFDISQFRKYGKLSKIKQNNLQVQSRTTADEYDKDEINDFALWKAWTEKDGDVFWNSDIGKGRPGWHIECSAMSMHYLGQTFDVHCGGVDNIFPHHENEIAQSEAATGKKFVNYWLHNENLLIEGKKMSKSLGNHLTLRDLIDKGYSPKAIRYLLMSVHYRQPLNFTFKGLVAAEKSIKRLYEFAYRLVNVKTTSKKNLALPLLTKFQLAFKKALNSDLNISSALAALFNFVRAINSLLDEGQLSVKGAKQILFVIIQVNSVLGLMDQVPSRETLSSEIKILLQKREKARIAQDWKTADQIREILQQKNIVIEDTPQGVRWRKILP